MIKIIDGNREVILTVDEMHALFAAVEDYADEYPNGTGEQLHLKLLKTYHLSGSDT